ncbi:MAG: hypothetical protein HOV83_21440, partial [Catenulispora sp.]|nr:hypothetical protein [Catenulispora sp.]
YAIVLCAAGAWLTAAVRQVVRAAQEVRRGGEPAPAPSEVHTEQEETVADV